MTVSQEFISLDNKPSVPPNQIKHNTFMRNADSDTESSNKKLKSIDNQSQKDSIASKASFESKNDYYMVIDHIDNMNQKMLIFYIF